MLKLSFQGNMDEFWYITVHVNKQHIPAQVKRQSEPDVSLKIVTLSSAFMRWNLRMSLSAVLLNINGSLQAVYKQRY